jgi:hypothetical protein
MGLLSLVVVLRLDMYIIRWNQGRAIRAWLYFDLHVYNYSRSRQTKAEHLLVLPLSQF